MQCRKLPASPASTMIGSSFSSETSTAHTEELYREFTLRLEKERTAGSSFRSWYGKCRDTAELKIRQPKIVEHL